MRVRSLLAALPLLLLSGAAIAAPGTVVWVDSLNLDNMLQDFGTPHARATVDGNPLKLGGKTFEHGVGTHASGVYEIPLDGKAVRFDATVGVDDETNGRGAVIFSVQVDGKTVAKTGVLHGNDAPQQISVPLTGAKMLNLIVSPGVSGIGFDHADWADASITLADGATELPPIAIRPQTLDAEARIRILSPDPAPAIHGARTVGATPGRPFLFRIPATGEKPLTFSAKGLPAGLSLDAATGIISGSLQKAGTNAVIVTVKGPKGSASRSLTITGGDHKLAQTPPMGWNSWNVWGTKVDEGKVRDAADQMLATGLADHGFGYINIDDAWEDKRNPDGTIQTNEKFPGMKALGDYIHSKGLRFGIYSSPGTTTCGGYTASYQHEAQDAQSYASWGVDYLKYDWCSYNGIAKDHSLPELQKPYAVMRKALDGVDRDILFSLCQYGWGDVWTWGADPSIGGNCWRTTDDIQDNWGSMHAIYEDQAGHEKYAGPGHWNDPDMLMVGVVGFGNTHPTHLRPNEQITHISMWCLLSSPLLIGCDMTKLDQFTLALLSNDEALDINQDPLGKPAGLISNEIGIGQVWARPLFDGTHAVGLVNPNPWISKIAVNWSELGIKGKQPVRDLWLHQNVGSYADGYSIEVPAHGSVLLKVGKAK